MNKPLVWKDLWDAMDAKHTPHIQWGSMDNDLCKVDALMLAHDLSHQSESPVYAVETKWGWTCAKNKPSLRFGKVIECYEGKELIA